MNTLALVRDELGTTAVDIEYVRSHPEWYLLEKEYIVENTYYYQYRLIGSETIESKIPWFLTRFRK